MNKTAISLVVGASLALVGAQIVHARGFGGARGGGESFGGAQRGGESRGGQRGGESFGAAQRGGGGGQRGGESFGGGGMQRGGGQRGGENSGAQGAAAGAAAENRKAPQYSGAQGAAAGYAAGNRNTPPVGAAYASLPTDAGFGMPAAGTGAAAYAGFHQTEPVSGSVYAARGAAVRTSYNGSGMFGRSWYTAHPGAWNPTGWTAGRARGIATWPTVGSWYGWAGSVQPIYYDYGNNIRYQGNQVYYGDQPVATADQYYQQASTLAQSQPAPDPKTGEWMPLGVFGLVRGTESDPHFVMQLAVNKSGAVAGNYYDVVSGTSVPVQGAVDKETQRLAWTVGDNKTTVGETGIYNLTQDQAPALIHIGKDKTQQWTLARLKQPGQENPQQ